MNFLNLKMNFLSWKNIFIKNWFLLSIIIIYKIELFLKKKYFFEHYI